MPEKAKEKNIAGKLVKNTFAKKTDNKLSSDKIDNQNNYLHSKKAVPSAKESVILTKVSKINSIDQKASTANKIAEGEGVSKNNPIKRTSKRTRKSKDIVLPIAEYYDLPCKYENTLIRLLAQTPTTLFVYWEISDSDIDTFKRIYGDDFFYKTKPVLIVHNITLNKHYEVEINDFANCWYLNTEDSDCVFDVELARRIIPTFNSDGVNFNSMPHEIHHGSKEVSNKFNNHEQIPEFVNIAKSNDLQSPNDHILFEKINEFVVFKNVQNGDVIKKNIKSFKFLKDIYTFYKEMYNEEIEKNPSSQFKF